MKCQRDWIYLENILQVGANPEMKRSLQKDVNNFDRVRTWFMKHMGDVG